MAASLRLIQTPKGNLLATFSSSSIATKSWLSLKPSLGVEDRSRRMMARLPARLGAAFC
eukprot:CAMPEP_0172514762 /NCGR_PEP_ID=MMETSP1066-20121228/262611_1 /TAXON_ID=671091 /ORGANISM="Coscinodiscus wailesii, Strain CCMP2513" /LENGTH=58 /DNA_ID=CAMNT_0013295557 /DNA_START=114 /DNA_END=287 /DNA_ORIENTATION=+